MPQCHKQMLLKTLTRFISRKSQEEGIRLSGEPHLLSFNLGRDMESTERLQSVSEVRHLLEHKLFLIWVLQSADALNNVSSLQIKGSFRPA